MEMDVKHTNDQVFFGNNNNIDDNHKTTGVESKKKIET